MKSKKPFVVHLYQVLTDDKSKPIEQLLEEVQGLSLESRLRSINNREMRLDHVERVANGLWMLDFTVLRFDNGPGRASKSSPLRDFDLHEGEGFGEGTAAIYDPVSGHIALQYNHYGARAAAICAYLSTLDDKPNGYEFRISLNDTALARLKKKTVFTRLELKVAPAQLSNAFRKANVALCSALAAQQDTFGGDLISIEVGLDRHSKTSTLPIGKTLKSLIHLAQGERDAVRHLQVSGKDSDVSPIDVVDLLEEARATTFKDMPLSGGLRYPLDDRLNRIERALRGWKAEKAIP